MSKAVEEEEATAAEVPVDLYGEFRFKVDAKGRLALPAKFRKVLSKDLIVSRELTDECLYVFEPAAFNEWVARLFEDKFGGYNASNRQHVLMRSKLKSRADGVDIDSSGRIMLKPEMREAVGIDKEVVLVGNTGYFEIWDAKTYDAMIDSIDLAMFYSDDANAGATSDEGIAPKVVIV